jgi:hypothetical protein
MWNRRGVDIIVNKHYTLHKVLPVAAEYHGTDYVARVLHDVDAASPWLVAWTDGVNHWIEPYADPAVAFARLASVVRAGDEDVALVHDGEQPRHNTAVVAAAESLLALTVHASDCAGDCRGDDANHPVDYWRHRVTTHI